MKLSLGVLAGILLFVAPVLADTATTFPDGSQGSVSGHCGVADECAVLTLSNGDSIHFFNEGAAFCKPFYLKIVRYHADAIVLSFDSEASSVQRSHGLGGQACPEFATTTYTLDGGNVLLTFNLNGDGSLSAGFSKP
jgi:hypothetical protein